MEKFLDTADFKLNIPYETNLEKGMEIFILLNQEYVNEIHNVQFIARFVATADKA